MSGEVIIISDDNGAYETDLGENFIPTMLWFQVPVLEFLGATMLAFEGWVDVGTWNRVARMELLTAFISGVLFNYGSRVELGFEEL